MHSSALFAALAIAAGASAQAVVTYNCSEALQACNQDVALGKTAASICSDKFTACEACATQEHSCRAGAQVQDGCTISAQKCYEQAVSPGSTLGYYGCSEAFATCNSAPQANRSFCAAQRTACESCQEEEKECRNAPGANQSLCSSGAGSCFSRAMDLSSE